MNKEIIKMEEILIGDRVLYLDSHLSGEALEVPAEVIDIRYILGKETYVIKTEQGKRKVVGANQIIKMD